MAVILGLDIGGNNVKAARLRDRGGSITGETVTLPVIDRPTLITALVDMDADPDLVVATETLSAARDLVPSAQEGVRFVADVLRKSFPPDRVRFLCRDYSLVTLEELEGATVKTACRNWAGTAFLAWRAMPFEDGLLIDCGTTSTDVVPVIAGVACQLDGDEDRFYSRLGTGELIWAGALNTAVTSLLDRVTIDGREVRTKSSCRARSGDVYRYLGTFDASVFPPALTRLAGSYRLTESAPTVDACAARLADLVARAGETDQDAIALCVAEQVRDAYLKVIMSAVERVKVRAETIWGVPLRAVQLAGLGVKLLQPTLERLFPTCVSIPDRINATWGGQINFVPNTETALGCALRGLEAFPGK